MDWWRPELVLPIVGALVAGAAIGFERQYRGRAAGFRTHILVCLCSALLMLAAVHQVNWMIGTPSEMIRMDPVRMAHGILTGIGFLCGGVIYREGFSIHGLTTAASLWITSAIGTLFGVASYPLAIGGALTTLFVLAGLRLFDERMPQLSHIEVAVRFHREAAASEAELRSLMSVFGLTPKAVTHRITNEGRTVELGATFQGVGRIRTEAIAAALAADHRVVTFDLYPRHE